MAKYEVRVRYAFEGTYKVVAEDRDEAERMVEEDCGLVLGGNIHTLPRCTGNYQEISLNDF